MDMDKNLGSEMSFLELIERYNILVPIIQRDYAQGRMEEQVDEIRKAFVKDLLSYITDGKNHSIDFVYGTISVAESEASKDSFVPLDGQQRLTTLFLLHLYISGVKGDGEHSSLVDKMTDNGICGFQYKTRESSTDFCKRLLCKENLFQEYVAERKKQSELEKEKSDLENRKKELEKSSSCDDQKNEFDQIQKAIDAKQVLLKPIYLSAVIKNQPWWLDEWLYDPTVAGMLVMLDEIACQAGIDVDNYYDKLFGDKKPVVFQCQPLNDYPCTDDLYLKMNARGVPLTLFEIFKAKYEANLPTEERSQFEGNIDGKWAIAFWHYKDADNDELCRSNTDAMMQNLIRTSIACSYASYYNRNAEAFDKPKAEATLKLLLEDGGTKMPFVYSKYAEFDVLPDKKQSRCLAFDYIKTNLNAIFAAVVTQLDKEVENEPQQWSENLKLVLKVLFGNTNFRNDKKAQVLSYSEILRFYAFVKAQAEGFNEKNMYQWMRFISNMDNSRDINKAGDMATALAFVDSTLESIRGTRKSVIQWIADSSDYYYSKNQFYEERLKAKLLIWQEENPGRSSDWANLIYEAEKDSYLKGQIGFILVFAGIDMNILSNTWKGTDLEYYEKALDYKEIALALCKHFKAGESSLVTEYKLERALLCEGNYMVQCSSNRLSLYNNVNNRDYSWRRLLEIDAKGELSASQKIVLNLFNMLEAEGDLESQLDGIISNNNLNDWTALLVKNVNLLKSCRQGFFMEQEQEQEQGARILLFGESQLNHYHTELYSYNLFLQKYEKNEMVNYYWVRTTNGIPGIEVKFRFCGEVFELVYSYNYANKNWERILINTLQGQSKHPENTLEEILGIAQNTLINSHLPSETDVENELNMLIKGENGIEIISRQL